MTSALEQSSSYKPGRIKAVCLDIDDTLLDSEGASRRGLRALVGNERAWPVWKAITDEHYARFVAGRIDYESMCVERTRAFFAAFGQQLSAAEAVRRETARMAAVQRSWCLFEDAWPCLEWLRATGLRTAVITNAPSAYQRGKIAALGLADAFDAVLISEEVGFAKPDPRIFAAACAALDVSPEEVVHVGDRLETDALGAARAGLHGVWLDRKRRGGLSEPGVPVIRNLYELTELLVCDVTISELPGLVGLTG